MLYSVLFSVVSFYVSYRWMLNAENWVHNSRTTYIRTTPNHWSCSLKYDGVKTFISPLLAVFTHINERVIKERAFSISLDLCFFSRMFQKVEAYIVWKAFCCNTRWLHQGWLQLVERILLMPLFYAFICEPCVYIITYLAAPSQPPRNIEWNLTNSKIFLNWEHVKAMENESEVTGYKVSLSA